MHIFPYRIKSLSYSIVCNWVGFANSKVFYAHFFNLCASWRFHPATDYPMYCNWSMRASLNKHKYDSDTSSLKIFSQERPNWVITCRIKFVFCWIEIKTLSCFWVCSSALLIYSLFIERFLIISESFLFVYVARFSADTFVNCNSLINQLYKDRCLKKALETAVC